jgi:hypothetical protein
MPRSKHRHKAGGKAVAHPGRGKPAKPLSLTWLDELEAEASTTGLPLFDWVEKEQAGRPEPQNPAEEPAG